MKDDNNCTVEIGSNNFQNLLADEVLLNRIIKIFNKYKIFKIKVDENFKGSKNTLASYINKECHIKTLQLEIDKKHRKFRTLTFKFNNLIKILEEIIKNMEG